jgi:hypothetical protein
MNKNNEEELEGLRKRNKNGEMLR